MAGPRFKDTTISAALSRAINQIEDQELKFKIDILVAKTARALSAARSINFVGYEDRELQEHSLELWNEVAPIFGAVFKELHALVDAAVELFPKKTEDEVDKDFDRAFDLLAAGDTHPVTGQPHIERNPRQVVTDLVQNYAWVIKQDIQQEALKLREPALMQQQWNLLGELEDFRDKVVGAMHAMVASVLGVFEEVQIEELFPKANEWVEMGVALRRQVADLCVQVEAHLHAVKDAPDHELMRNILEEEDERTARLLKLPSVNSLRAADRHELAEFRRKAARLRSSPFTAAQVQEFLDAYATFLASLQSLELKERLKVHDTEVAAEAREALVRATNSLDHDLKQAMMFLAHASRRVARLYGLSPPLDEAARELRDLNGRQVDVEELNGVLWKLTRALETLYRD